MNRNTKIFLAIMAGLVIAVLLMILGYVIIVNDGAPQRQVRADATQAKLNDAVAGLDEMLTNLTESQAKMDESLKAITELQMTVIAQITQAAQTPLPASTPAPPDTPIPTDEPMPTEKAAAPTLSPTNTPLPLTENTWRTDFLPEPLTQKIFAEPGVYPGVYGKQVAWDHMENEITPVLVGEDAFSYLAIGGFRVTFSVNNEEKEVLCPWREGEINLVFFKGRNPCEGDCNSIVTVRDYVPGAGIYAQMPVGVYVSLDWTIKQIENAFNQSPNCGNDGCDEVIIVVIDLETGEVQRWRVNPKNYRDWTRLDSLK